MPVISPVAGFNARPAGSAGLTAKPTGVVPPAIVTGVKATAAVSFVSTLVATASVEVNAGLTVRLNVLFAVAVTLSVIVTV